MKRIDLVCKLISPLVFAGLLTYLHAGYCSLIMAIWCMASFLTEWVLVRRIWDLSPVLWQPRSHHHHLSLPSESVYERRGSGFVDDRDVGTESAVAAAARKKKKDSDSRTPLVDRDAFSNRERQSLFAAEDTGHHQQRRGQGGVGSSLVKRGILSFREYSHNIVFLASLAYAIIYINMMRFVCLSYLHPGYSQLSRPPDQPTKHSRPPSFPSPSIKQCLRNNDRLPTIPQLQCNIHSNPQGNLHSLRTFRHNPHAHPYSIRRPNPCRRLVHLARGFNSDARTVFYLL